MGTGFMQLAYNLADVLWLGRLSGEAVAATSAAGFVAWITFSIAFTTKVGSEVAIAQAIGEKKTGIVHLIGAHAIGISLILSTLMGAAMLIFMDEIVGFFRLEPDVNALCKDYMTILACIMPLWMIGPTFAGIYNGTGNSKLPFYASCIGLCVNIAIDPLLIFGAGEWLPAYGVKGAAFASAIAVGVETTFFACFFLNKKHHPYPHFKFFAPLKRNISWNILRVGAPAAMQSALFAIFTTFVVRIAAGVGGYVGVAVQGAGSQIESLSWTTANGISTALGAYIGQNFGARKLQRIIKSFAAGTSTISAFGLVAGSIFVIFGKEIFTFMVPTDNSVIAEGAQYLFILGISQLFLCAEIASSGAFNGLGKSYIPATVSVIFNALRIPLAILFSGWWGLTGIWWAICVSTIAKGTILSAAFPLYIRHLKRQWQNG
ncbi:MATE family efflux transporter [Bacteroidia bacterium]|nr:MATE family efflux transporter [Bacteroidia bacterium]